MVDRLFTWFYTTSLYGPQGDTTN